MPTQKKEEAVKNLIAQLTLAKGIILTDYQGLNATQLQELREKLGEQESTFQVIKNTLFKIALKRARYPQLELEGPTAAVFVTKDIFGALKLLARQAETEEIPKIKSGFWKKEALSPDSLDQLAKIPSLEYLKGLVIGSLASPLNNLVDALDWNLKQLVFTLKQIPERG